MRCIFLELGRFVVITTYGKQMCKHRQENRGKEDQQGESALQILKLIIKPI